MDERLRITHTSAVTEDQIDHLGHMNVRFYAVNANAGTRAVLAGLPGWGDRPHLVHDIYTRHHREQLLGTPLEVRSALLAPRDGVLRIHHELAASDSGTLAATFVHGVSPIDGSGARTALPAPVEALAEAQAIEPLPHAAPRSIALDSDLLGSSPSLDTVLERGLAMRKPRRVGEDECDAQGRYRPEMAPMLTWGGEQIDGEISDVLHETSDGKLMAWASMETRVQFGKLPRPGDRIQSFGAAVAVHDKVTHRVHWAYDLDTGELLTGFESISLAFDTRERKPMRIPDGYRARELQRVQPDLVPGAPEASRRS